MNTEEIKNKIMKELDVFSPVFLEDYKYPLIGFVNDNNGADLVIFIMENELVMNFAFQSAHFDLNDVDSCIIHARKFLTSEYSSVEFFFQDGKSFGGSRLSSTCDFSSIEKIVDCYSCGNEKASQGLYKTIQENKITVKAINFSNTINRIVNLSYENGEYIIEDIR